VASRKIKIRLKDYDHEFVDQGTKVIVDVTKKAQFGSRRRKRLIDILEPETKSVDVTPATPQFAVAFPPPPRRERGKRHPKPAEAWREAVERLRPSDDAADRERQFEAFVDVALEALPDLAPYRDDIRVYLRTASAAAAASARIAGEPRSVVRPITLPQLSAEDLLKEASLAGQVKLRILEEDMVPASAVHELLGLVGANPRQYANRLRARGDLLAIPDVRNRYLYPVFQFDLAARRPHTEAMAVNRMLHAADDPWGVAGWWTQPNSRLSGAAPKELLGTGQSDRLLAAARDVLAE